MKTLATLIFICSLFVTGCVGKSVWRKTYVEMKSNMTDGITVRVHCKSKQDDLGFHDITTMRSWSFSFIPSFLGNTLFFCSFSWPGQFRYFDIYDQNRDEMQCSTCIYKISPNGPCLLDKMTGDFSKCSPWNPPSRMGRKPLTLMYDGEK
ncbi:hypothetical protein EUGRSUZ_G00339 [Eucalyptus grandis]|uniref:Uncharacterized protein n=2 Tax=Eucalyptus grandis TaxID=71139 RepID=A0ACC3K039_EUCGR|nr:hypothetical protein EUGRSUZ_G00339 [Eucalyptus grandis]